MVTVWLHIIPCKVWKEARSIDRVNKAWIKVNHASGRFMARNGAVAVRHRELELGTGEIWRLDGVHLNVGGIDLWTLALQGGTKTAVRMWRDEQA